MFPSSPPWTKLPLPLQWTVPVVSLLVYIHSTPKHSLLPFCPSFHTRLFSTLWCVSFSKCKSNHGPFLPTSSANHLFKNISWNSLTVQWLGVGTFTAMAWVQSLVGELRSGKPRSATKKKKNLSWFSVALRIKRKLHMPYTVLHGLDPTCLIHSLSRHDTLSALCPSATLAFLEVPLSCALCGYRAFTRAICCSLCIRQL